MKHKQNEGSSCKEHYGIMISLDLISVVNIDLHAINSFMTESLSYGNQSIHLLCKSMDWFLYDRDFSHGKDKNSSRQLTTLKADSKVRDNF